MRHALSLVSATELKHVIALTKPPDSTCRPEPGHQDRGHAFSCHLCAGRPLAFHLNIQRFVSRLSAACRMHLCLLLRTFLQKYGVFLRGVKPIKGHYVVKWNDDSGRVMTVVNDYCV